MQKLFFITSIVIFSIVGCNKESANKEANVVFVRIKNSSSQSFNTAEVATTAYGSVSAGTITGYKALTIPVYAIGANVAREGQSFYVGMLVCGTPMPPPVASGYYTLEIKPLTADGYYPSELTID